jgi:hypothetical protein
MPHGKRPKGREVTMDISASIKILAECIFMSDLGCTL